MTICLRDEQRSKTQYFEEQALGGRCRRCCICSQCYLVERGRLKLTGR